jgi:hypothetical protein
MLPYILLYVFLLSCVIYSWRQRAQEGTFWVVAISVFLFTALRDQHVGPDTFANVQFFLNPQKGYLDSKADIGYEILIYILRLFSTNRYYFIFFISLIYYVGVIYLIYRYSRNKTMSWLLFCIGGSTFIFFFNYMFLIRQAVATSFFLIAFCKYAEATSNWKIYIPLYLIAISIHGSCLVTLPFLIVIKQIQFHKYVWIVLIIGSYIIGALQIFKLSSYFDILLPFAKIFDLTSKYTGYMGDVTFGQTDTVGIFNMFLLPFSVIGLCIAYFNRSKCFSIFTNMFLISVVLTNLFSDNLMWARLIQYFSIFAIIVIPNEIIKYRKQYHQLIIYVMIILYFSYKADNVVIHLLDKKTEDSFVPYRSWIDKNL